MVDEHPYRPDDDAVPQLRRVREELERDDVLPILQAAVEYMLELPPNSVTATNAFGELGLDSLQAAQLLAEMEQRLEVELQIEFLDEVSPATTITQAADLVANWAARSGTAASEQSRGSSI